MSLEREKGTRHVQFACDGCPEALDTETDDFGEARAAMKRAGWTTTKVGSDWLHHCRDCSEEH